MPFALLMGCNVLKKKKKTWKWLHQLKYCARFYPVFCVVCDLRKCICILKTTGLCHLKIIEYKFLREYLVLVIRYQSLLCIFKYISFFMLCCWISTVQRYGIRCQKTWSFRNIAVRKRNFENFNIILLVFCVMKLEEHGRTDRHELFIICSFHPRN